MLRNCYLDPARPGRVDRPGTPGRPNRRRPGRRNHFEAPSGVQFGVQLARLIAVVFGVEVVGMGELGVMGGLLVVSILVRQRGFAVMLGGAFVVFGGLVVVFDLFRVGHGGF
jgi:hypothetical protein